MPILKNTYRQHAMEKTHPVCEVVALCTGEWGRGPAEGMVQSVPHQEEVVSSHEGGDQLQGEKGALATSFLQGL